MKGFMISAYLPLREDDVERFERFAQSLADLFGHLILDGGRVYRYEETAASGAPFPG